MIDAIVREKTRRKSVDELADEVIEGKWGSGIERKQRLEAAGYDYTAVQQRVDEKLATMSKQYYTVRSGDTLTAIARRFGKLRSQNWFVSITFLIPITLRSENGCACIDEGREIVLFSEQVQMLRRVEIILPLAFASFWRIEPFCRHSRKQ